MNRDEVEARVREFASLCRARGLPVTVQRRAILEAVLRSDEHPTADQVFEVVGERVPGVSRTTVYRVLETLVELGVIRRLHHPGPAARFEGKIGRHHHLICRKCNAVIDVEHAALDELPLPNVADKGFEIDDFSVHFTGLCAKCRESS